MTAAPQQPGYSYSHLVALDAKEADGILAGTPQEAARLAQAAAKYGIVDAQLTWAQMLMDGRGVPRDPEAAFRWFCVAAESRRADALNMRGRCHERGWGTAVDPAEATRLYRLAADMGHDWALFNLASLYLNGQGVAADDRAALALFVRAARKGLGKAMTMIGMAREQGWGGARVKARAALFWYLRGAARDDFRAHFHLARISLLQGDVGQALRHLPQAVESAYPDFCREIAPLLKSHDDDRVRTWGLRAEQRVREAEAAVLPALRERKQRKRRAALRLFRR